LPIRQVVTRKPLSRDAGHLHPQMPGVCHAHRVRNAQPHRRTVSGTVNDPEAFHTICNRHRHQSIRLQREEEGTKSSVAFREKGFTFLNLETLSIALPSAKVKSATDLLQVAAPHRKDWTSHRESSRQPLPLLENRFDQFSAHPARDLHLHLWKCVMANREPPSLTLRNAPVPTMSRWFWPFFTAHMKRDAVFLS
jgi:hypothetical protein